MMIRGFLLMVALLLTAFASADDKLHLNEHQGPYDQGIDQIASLKVNEGYFSLDPEDTRRLMEAMQNPGFDHNWYLAPTGRHDWAAVISYDETGHVKDEEKIDPDAILSSLREGNVESNKERTAHGWSTLELVGWRVEPHYESDTKRLSWAVNLQSNGHPIINYTTKILGRTGVTTVVLVTAPEKLDASIADLKEQLGGLQYTHGNAYSEFRSGDKLAAYGLGGLIAGGAVAVAAKTGLLKYLFGALAAGGKAIFAAIAAGIAGLRAMFTRKKPR